MTPRQRNELLSTKIGRATLVLLAFTICALPTVAMAAKPPATNNSQLSIAVTPKQVTFGRAVTLTGKLKGNNSAAQGIALQMNPYPYAGYVSSATTTTDANGNYTFTAKPSVNTRYRVQSTTLVTAQTSGEITVPVAIHVSLRLSDRTPAAHQLVLFSGFTWPQHDGKTVRIQRRTSTGAWATIARVKLKDDGDSRSKYGRRMRIARNGTYRSQVVADADHATGVSAARTARVH